MKKFARGALVSASSNVPSPSNSQSLPSTSVHKDAMSLLGITEFDLDPLSLQHFMNHTKTIEEASLLFKRHTERRLELLSQLQSKHKQLLHQPPKALKPSGEVLHEQHIISMLNQQADNMEQENGQILRHLAIQQLRTVFHFQKSNNQTTQIDAQIESHFEKVMTARRAARKAVESREFIPRQGDPGEPRPIKDVELHLRRAQAVRDSQIKQLEENAVRVQGQVAKARHNSEEILNENIARAKQKVSETERKLSLVQPRLIEKQQQLQTRASKRDSLTKEKQTKIKENEEQRIEREEQQFRDREQRAKALLLKKREEIQARLAKEREDFERRNRAAEEIWDHIKQQRAETAKVIEQHQIEAEQRLEIGRASCRERV
jgi:hypothetical protein